MKDKSYVKADASKVDSNAMAYILYKLAAVGGVPADVVKWDTSLNEVRNQFQGDPTQVSFDESKVDQSVKDAVAGFLASKQHGKLKDVKGKK